MTVKGQITVPRDIRDALGLKPGQKVGIELDAAGDAKIVKVDAEAEKARWLRRVEEVQRRFKAQDPMPGMDGLAYQRWLREGPEV